MSLLRNIAECLKWRLFLVDRLNDLSRRISYKTYTRDRRDLTSNQVPHLKLTVLLLLVFTVAYGFLCHYVQERDFRKNFESFMVKGEYVLTTNDAGYYMTLAKNYQSSGILIPPQVFPESLEKDSSTILDSQIVGRILPILISQLSSLLGVSLEKAGVFFTYGSVLLTSILVCAFFWSLGQPFLGLVAAFASVASFPVHTRMVIGMMDTDLLNLPFLFGILLLFYHAVKADRQRTALLCCLIAGLVNFGFYLWFGKAGFTLPLLVSLVLIFLAFRKSLRLCVTGGLFFLLGCGPEQVLNMFESLQGFLNAYLWRVQQEVSSREVFSDYATVIWGTISEVRPATIKVIDTWFGSRYLYFIGLFGWLLWLLQDWRRIFLCFPFVIFAVMFHTSGLRFSFYSTPFVWVGIAVACIALGRLLYSKFDPSTQSLFSKSVVSICLVGTLVLSGSATRPGGLKPNPIIHADEVLEVQKYMEKRANPKAVIVSWWDAGYLISYYTGLPTAFNEGSQLGLKTLYVARALVSSDPNYAANEIRSASYFLEEDLSKFYPKRPPVELARGTDHDIFVFLPTNLESKMEGVSKIAATGQPKDSQDPKQSAFFNLYHKLPERWGEFERIGVADSGAALYRLPAPVSSSRKN
jgi:asparagine N-glycosylation enzyme membrane subunit Stt3